MKKIESFLIFGILSYLFINVWQLDELFYIVLKALMPIGIGVFISFLFEPFIRFMEKKIHCRQVACVLVYSLFIGVMVFLIWAIVPQLQAQFELVSIDFPELFQYLKKEVGFQEIFQLANQFKGVFSSVSFIGIGFSAAFYLSFDFTKIRLMYYDLSPRKFRKKYWIISKEMGSAILMYGRYLLYDTLLFFLLASLFIFLSGIDYPLAFGLLLALTNLIPYVGPYIGLVPFAFFAALSNQFWIALIIVFSLQLIENNFISPFLLKNMIALHPVWGIFGMTFFGALFGFWGMVFSRLIMALLKILYNHLFLLEKSCQMVYNASEIDDKDK